MFFHVFSTWKSVTKVGRNLTSSAREERNFTGRWTFQFHVQQFLLAEQVKFEGRNVADNQAHGSLVTSFGTMTFLDPKKSEVPWLLCMEGSQPAGFYGRPRETTTGCHHLCRIVLLTDLQVRSLPMAMPTWSAHWMLVPTGHSTEDLQMFGKSDPIPLSDLHRFAIYRTETNENHEDVFDSSNTFQVERSNHSESVDVILFHHMLFRNPSCFLCREAWNLHMTGWWFQIFSISYSLHMCWYFL